MTTVPPSPIPMERVCPRRSGASLGTSVLACQGIAARTPRVETRTPPATGGETRRIRHLSRTKSTAGELKVATDVLLRRSS